jgi:hypothetical protein
MRKDAGTEFLAKVERSGAKTLRSSTNKSNEETDP